MWSDQEKSQTLMRQRRRLEESLAMDADLGRRVDDIQAYFDLAREGEAVVEELRKEIDQLREVADKLETQTLLSGENDMRNAIVTIHPGAGGTESQDWAEMLMRMYLRWAERQGFRRRSTNISRAKKRASNPRRSGSTATTLMVADERNWRAPAGAHLALRSGQAPRILLLPAFSSRRKSMTPSRSTSSRKTFASIPTVRAARADST